MGSKRRTCTVADAALKLGISYHRALRLVMIHEIDGWREGDGWRVDGASVERYAKAMAADQQQPAPAA